MKANPFFELYVGDRISSSEFVTIFSDQLVPHTEALFLPGNIVVTGIQGCGKSMLLSLLKPRVRIEYLRAGVDFPVPKSLRKFICASVNLAHSSVIDFGYRDYSVDGILRTELLFADFLNFLVCDALFDSIEAYLNSPEDIRAEVGLRFSRDDFDAISGKLSGLDVWEQWISPCHSLAEFRSQMKSRIRTYRRFLHGKDDSLPSSFADTMTAIGTPIAAIAELLKETGAIDSDTNVFVDIDQYEELGNISSTGAAPDYRAVINKALASRIPAVSYRIGTRGYSWRGHGKIHGTSGNLELMRDYKYIELDQILKRDELDSARGNQVFDRFAEDVFYRRLKYAEFNLDRVTASGILKAVYGDPLPPERKVNNEMGLRQPEKYIETDLTWSDETRDALHSLAKRNLFSAKLGEFWVRQKGEKSSLSVPDEMLPWERSGARWWKKERSHAIPMIVASQSHQKVVWGGAKEVIELSGGSILAFLGINQFIWSTWLQRNDRPESTRASLPTIETGVQSVAIHRASSAWYDMIFQQSARSSERAKFVKISGDFLRGKLLNDKSLSYPGASGFSVTNEELDGFSKIRGFLEELADYGNILMLPHTSKNSGDVSRTKFYFHPILCPYLGLPYVRTKEPYYGKIREIAEWAYRSGLDVKLTGGDAASQKDLFR